MWVAGKSYWGYTGTRMEMLELKSHRSLVISWQRLSSCANQLVLKSHASACEHEREVFQHEGCCAAISGTSRSSLCVVLSVRSLQPLHFDEGWSWQNPWGDLSHSEQSGPRGFKCWLAGTFQCDYHYFSLLFFVVVVWHHESAINLYKCAPT